MDAQLPAGSAGAGEVVDGASSTGTWAGVLMLVAWVMAAVQAGGAVLDIDSPMLKDQERLSWLWAATLAVGCLATGFGFRRAAAVTGLGLIGSGLTLAEMPEVPADLRDAWLWALSALGAPLVGVAVAGPSRVGYAAESTAPGWRPAGPLAGIVGALVAVGAVVGCAAFAGTLRMADLVAVHMEDESPWDYLLFPLVITAALLATARPAWHGRWRTVTSVVVLGAVTCGVGLLLR